jgi:hypothetical protein
MAGLLVAELSGKWIFESETIAGRIRRRLELREEGRKLFVTGWKY